MYIGLTRMIMIMITILSFPWMAVRFSVVKNPRISPNRRNGINQTADVDSSLQFLQT